jgi:hypothetical protein
MQYVECVRDRSNHQFVSYAMSLEPLPMLSMWARNATISVPVKTAGPKNAAALGFKTD